MAKFRYQHIKSSVEGKAPTAAQIKTAEIGVNDFAGDEKLFIKNSEDEVVDFPRGYSRTYIDEMDRVVAESLNDLNSRKLDASAYTPTDLSNYYTKDETSGKTEIQDALDEKADTATTYTKDEVDARDLWVSGTGENAVVQKGGNNVAAGANSVAEGYGTKANAPQSHAEGYGTVASAPYTHAEGNSTSAASYCAHAEGNYTVASAPYTHAEGYQTKAIGETSHAEGESTSAMSRNSHAEGYSTTASGTTSHAEGYYTKSTNDYSHAEGYYTLASGYNSHAEGYSTSAVSYYTHAEGNITIASGNTSHAEGHGTSATSNSSHAEGRNTLASGDTSHAEGYMTIASGDYSHAEGYSTSATSHHTHAEGSNTLASGSRSHAEGDSSKASGSTSHAEGNYTLASGMFSHAEGNWVSATSNSSHAEGVNTITTNYAEHASGKHNVSSSASTTFGDSGNTLFSVGNGSANDARHNAFEIRQNGDIYFTSGGTDVKLQDSIPAVDGYADSVKYNSTTHYVEFYHGTTAGTKVFEYDASPFLIDGMVEDVEIEDVEISGETVTCLVISFNTAAGKQDINIPLSDIFDPSNYYTKADIDDMEYVISQSLNDLNTRKLDASAYTPTDLSDYYTKSETSGATEIQNALDGKSDTGHTHDDRYYTEIEIDNLLAGKVSTSDIDQVIDDTTSASTGAVSTSAVYGFVTSYTPSITVDQVLDDTTSASTNPVSSKAVYDVIVDNEYVWANAYAAMSGAISSHTVDTDIHVTSADKTAWNAKLDATAYTPTDLSNYYTKTEVDERDLWVSGTGENAIAQKGGNNTASGKLSVAMGSGTTASGDYSVAEGFNTKASGYYSHAEGYKTSATSYASHAEGWGTTASGDYSHAEGNSTIASGNTSHAEGFMTSATTIYSHAEGNYTTASGGQSHAEGSSTIASGDYSHAEGYSTSATSQSSHAEGNGTIASGRSSHAEGVNTKAKGYASHAEGSYTVASGQSSHAEGYNTKANNQSEHASGQYNVSSKASSTFGDGGNTLFSVGNGTADNARHNAFEIRQNGDIYITSGNTNIKLQDRLGGTIDQTIDSTTSASTNAVSTSAVYTQMDGIKLKKITQSDYDQLQTKDPNTLYVITD